MITAGSILNTLADQPATFSRVEPLTAADVHGNDVKRDLGGIDYHIRDINIDFHILHSRP